MRFPAVGFAVSASRRPNVWGGLHVLPGHQRSTSARRSASDPAPTMLGHIWPLLGRLRWASSAESGANSDRFRRTLQLWLAVGRCERIWDQICRSDPTIGQYWATSANSGAMSADAGRTWPALGRIGTRCDLLFQPCLGASSTNYRSVLGRQPARRLKLPPSKPCVPGPVKVLSPARVSAAIAPKFGQLCTTLVDFGTHSQNWPHTGRTRTTSPKTDGLRAGLVQVRPDPEFGSLAAP